MPNHPPSSPTLADLGEGGLLAQVFPRLPASATTLVGPGDDAAVVRAPDARVVATTDVLVEGKDFRREWSTAEDVGWKAVAQNLADVAAMGAVPTSLLVGLVAPPDLPVRWALGLVDGMAAACTGTGAGVVGGDLSSGPLVVVAVTALGDLQGREPVLRSGARPGDVVALAGSLGRSAAGLELLRRSSAAAPDLVDTHRRPTPPYACGVAAARAGATAMLDVSDGLVRDVGRLARASTVTVRLDGARLLDAFGNGLLVAASALHPDEAAQRSQVREWVLAGGEDHGLVATFAPGVTPPEGFVPVGHVCQAEADTLVLVDGSPVGASGWDHFRPQD